jgi:hypothetical protein
MNKLTAMLRDEERKLAGRLTGLRADIYALSGFPRPAFGLLLSRIVRRSRQGLRRRRGKRRSSDVDVGSGLSVPTFFILEAEVGLERTRTSFADHSIHRVSRNLPRFDTAL